MKKRYARKAAAGPKTTPEDIAQQYLATVNARNRFLAVSLNMGWRLAIGFVVPVIIGVNIDNRFDSSPAYTLAALMIGVFLSCIIIRDTIQEVNEEQAIEEAEAEKLKKASKES